MKAIFAYKILDNFWKPKDRYFWKLAELSIASASKFYTTVLYSDENTKKVFDNNGIVFDSYQKASPGFDIITEHTYGLAKMFAMIDQKNPYITLDLDTVLFSRIDTTKHILYGHKEINMLLNKPVDDMITDLEYLQTYYQYPYTLFTKEHGYTDRDIDWRTYPSNSLMVVNAPRLVADVCQEVINIIKEELNIVPPKYTVQFYEQFLFYNFLRYYKAEAEFLYNEPPGSTLEDSAELFSNRYLHLDRYNSDTNIKKLINKLLN